MNFTKTEENLKKHGFEVSVFPDRDSACRYLNEAIDGVSVAFGGSMTLQELALDQSLAAHNEFWWHWRIPEDSSRPEVLRKAAEADVYLLSANGLSETGEIVNIDGTGNRLASAYFGHKKVYFVVGRNKIAPDLDGAVKRARNVASPKNAMRFNAPTPCAQKGDRCYDCDSPARICRGLSVLWRKMMSMEMEVVLIDEDLGY